MSKLEKLTQANLPLGYTSLDCYLTATGDRRIGLEGAALAIAKPKDYLANLLTSDVEGYPLRSLQANGFTGEVVEGEVDGGMVQTISIPDFTRFLVRDAVNFNPAAIALLAAFAEVGLERKLGLR